MKFAALVGKWPRHLLLSGVDMEVGVLDMISLEDCIGLCGLDESEVLAIAEHEHIPELAAAALANYLSKQPHGGEVIRAMIVDDIRAALDEGRIDHAAELFMALRHFLDQHPEAKVGLVAN